MIRCPRCQNEDPREVETTLPSRDAAGKMRVAVEFFCPRCKLTEGGVQGEATFDALYQRWHPRPP